MLLVLATTSPALLLRPATPVGAARCRVRRAAPVCAEPAGGALAQLGDQFEAALGSLPASERYNAVLESLASADLFPDMEVLGLSGNLCCDKKPAAINWIEVHARTEGRMFHSYAYSPSCSLPARRPCSARAVAARS